MSTPSLVLRPAVDARPPAEVWSGICPLDDTVPANQPPLRFVEPDDRPLTEPPTAARVPLSVDHLPSGVASSLGSELDAQARTWTPWFAQLLTEALDGRRPLESLARWLDEWVLAEVGRRVRMQRRVRLRAATPAARQPTAVVSLRAQFAQPHVLEVAAHLRRGARSHACAFQLTRTRDRWRCTALQVVEGAVTS